MKVCELTGAYLDYWVARADESWKWAHQLFPTMTLDPTFSGVDVFDQPNGERVCMLIPHNPFRQDHQVFAPSSNWQIGGPLIEREGIDLQELGRASWSATHINNQMIVSRELGATPLVAAMRALVASKYGAEVPEALGQ